MTWSYLCANFLDNLAEKAPTTTIFKILGLKSIQEPWDCQSLTRIRIGKVKGFFLPILVPIHNSAVIKMLPWLTLHTDTSLYIRVRPDLYKLST